MTVTPTDKFIVNRDDQVKTVEQQALMATLQNDDLLLVNRADSTFKITGEDLIDSLIDDLIISKPLLSTADPEVGQAISAGASASGGKGPYSYAYQWLKTGDVEILGATSATYTPVSADAGETLACRITATDTQPESAVGTSDYSNAVTVAAGPPVIGSIALADDAPGGNRFTGKAFTTSIVMTDDGIPNSDKEVKAEVEGALTIAGATDEIVGISEVDLPGLAAVIYTGNSGTQSITTGTAPDLVWIKARTETTDHNLFDTVRGPEKRLFSNTTAQESASNITLTSFNTDGFTISSANDINKSGADFVAWCWSASDTTVTNNDGTIQSEVRSNGDFSIVTFNTGDTTASIGHGLNNSPAFIITKSISATNPWYCYHTSLGKDGYIALNQSSAGDTIPDYWGNPNALTFGVQTSSGNNFGDMIAYCWAESPTQSFGEYTGNASDYGTTQKITLGFEPAWVMIKRTDGASAWWVFDSARGSDKNLVPNTAAAEGSYPDVITLDSDGFTLISPDTETNKLGQSYIYAAFAQASKGTELTLASDANLANGAFESGNLTKQSNSPITPVSSAITNVADTAVTANWSDGISASVTNREDAFNGLSVPSAYVSSNTPLTWNAEPGMLASRVDVDVNDPRSGEMTVTVITSLQTYTNSNTIPKYGNHVVPFVLGGREAITSITVTGGSTYNYMSRVFLDEEVLLDGITYGGFELSLTDTTDLDLFEVGDAVQGNPNWNQSEVWSDGITAPSSPQVAFPITYAFNGDLVTGNNCCFPDPASYVQVDFTGLSDAKEVVIYYTANGTGVRLEVNGVGIALSDVSPGPTTGTINVTGTGLNNLYWNEIDGLNYIGVYGVEVDGVLLVNTGVPDPYAVKVTAITPATPSIATDGGTWNVGEVVTGPPKAVTGTFVSADPSVPSMTLSNTTAGWSAGNYAQNTVNNPVNIQPLTSDIVGVSQPKPIAGDPSAPTGNAETYDFGPFLKSVGVTHIKGFKIDGQYPDAADPYSAFSGLPTLDGVSIPLWGINPADVTEYGSIPTRANQDWTGMFNGLNSLGAQAGDDVGGFGYTYWCTFPEKLLISELTLVNYYLYDHPDKKSIYVLDQDDNWITLAGNYVYTPPPTLVFADDKDLNQIVANDEVYANQSYTPVSSAITNVEELKINQSFSILDRSSDTMSPYSGNYGQLFSNDTSNGPSWSNGNTGIATLFELNTASPLSSLEFMMTGPADFGVKLLDGNGTVHEIPNFSGPGGGVYTSVPISGITSIKKVQVDGYGNAFGMYAIKINGSVMIDNVPISVGSTLRLTNNTALENFRVGDAVSGAPVTANLTAIDIYGLYYEDGNVGTSPLVSVTEAAEIGEQNYFNSDINDANKSGNKGFYVYDVNTITIAYSGLTAGDSIGIVAGGASGGASADALNMSATGDVNNSGNPFVVYDGGGSKDSLPKTRSNIIVNASSGSFVLKSELASGTSSISQVLIQWIEGLSEGVVSITAIDEATPSITTDGGSWVNGNVVIGPTIPPATGTVGSVDVAGPTLTLSESSGRWVTTTKVTMNPKPAVSVKAYLNFDSNGNVTGYQSIDPGFVNMGIGLSKTLTFPATFNSGDAPDTELPEGTSLRTKVKATNPEGESTSLWSNRVTPGTSSLSLEMGEFRVLSDEFAAGAMTVATYEKREADQQAAIATNDLQRKKDNAEAQLLAVAQLTKELAPKPSKKPRKKKG